MGRCWSAAPTRRSKVGAGRPFSRQAEADRPADRRYPLSHEANAQASGKKTEFALGRQKYSRLLDKVEIYEPNSHIAETKGQIRQRP
jgi:hypothetical protein